MYACLAPVFVVTLLTGCDSAGPAKRNIEVVYRFENLRKQASGDEWAAIKPVLDRASLRPVEVNKSRPRNLGSVEVATYEAKCVLPSLLEFEKVQADLEALAASEGHAGNKDRIETYLSRVNAVYQSNFVAATVNVAVSGASVSGHHIRIYGTPGEPPTETTAGYNGIWVVRLNVVPQTQWVYGLSEDPSGRIPTRYFKINVATRKQERVEEPEFLAMFAASDKAAAAAKVAAEAKPAAKSGVPSASSEDNALQETRRKEDEALRKKRAAADRKGASGASTPVTTAETPQH